MRALSGIVLMLSLSAFLAGPARAIGIDWWATPLPSLDGGTIDPDTLAGHVVLVVNTASMCGFTPQYVGLQELWQRYRGQGLVVLGVPSDDFGGQEYADDGEIEQFCSLTYGIDFPMLTRQAVKGHDAHPLFAWLAREAGMLGSPKWNFYKYLVGRDGRLVTWYSSATGPGSPALAKAIEGALEAPAP